MKVATLQQRNAELQAQVDRLSEERERYRGLYVDLMERFRKLELGIAGQKRERLPVGEQQLSLQLIEQLLEARDAGDEETTGAAGEEGDEAPKEIVVERHTRAAKGRKPLPSHLPRIEQEILPPEVLHEGLDAFERIGEESSEIVERRPSLIVVVRSVRPKFVRKDRDRDATTVYIAEPPELPIPRGIAGPSLLADSIVKRWQDHLPLNRLEGIYAREGLEIARSTMGSWHEQLAELVQPVVDAMWQDAYLAPYLCTDATGVLVQAKEKCSRSHFWVVLAPERHALFAYSKKHDKAAVDELLKDYAGYLVADAHTVYDHLYASEKVTEVGCWAHARRYFFKAMKTDPERAREALSLIGGLFRLERELATAPRKKKEQARRKRAKPIVDAFFAWCDKHVGQVVDESPIAKAIGYARNQKVALSRFLEDGRLPIHNNASELALRREAVGRKNWLFVGSDDGGATNATFVSLLASCQMHGVEPWSYLRDLFCLLPSWKTSRALELAPVNWAQTSALPAVQEALEANLYRRLLQIDVENIVADVRARG